MVVAAPPHAFFLTAPQGPRFALVHAPGDGHPVRAAVLLAPPFAEELNKSRRMLALQSRALVDAGCAVLRLDLGGCGDSAGEFAQASWSGWIDDLLAGAAWLRARWPSAPLVLWGVRAGCLLARALIDRLTTPPMALLAWQPPADGRSVLQQFLRLKVYGEAIGTPAADTGAATAAPGSPVSSGSDGDGGSGGVMARLKAELAAGRAVTVAGYALPAAVSDGLAAATLAPPSAGAPALPSAWLELSSRPDAVPSPALVRLAQRWIEAGHPATRCVVDGPAFWLATEIEEAPALIAAGVAAVDGWLAPR